jgi:hypothetical protein
MKMDDFTLYTCGHLFIIKMTINMDDANHSGQVV